MSKRGWSWGRSLGICLYFSLVKSIVNPHFSKFNPRFPWPSGGQPVALHVAEPLGRRVQIAQPRVAVDDGTVTLQAGAAEAVKGLDLIEIS